MTCVHCGHAMPCPGPVLHMSCSCVVLTLVHIQSSSHSVYAWRCILLSLAEQLQLHRNSSSQLSAGVAHPKASCMNGLRMTDGGVSGRRWIGVETVYLTENLPGKPEMRGPLKQYIDEGFVVYTHEPHPQAQIRVWTSCLQHRAKHNWIAFFDADEFLILREGCVLRIVECFENLSDTASLFTLIASAVQS